MKTWLFPCFLLLSLGPCGLYGQGLISLEKIRNHAAGLSLPAFHFTAGTFFYGESGKGFVGTHFLAKTRAPLPYFFSSAATGNLLPKWTPESLPFFCRVEHDCGKKLPFAFKFRLGSVEYVDWLEGKSIWLGQ